MSHSKRYPIPGEIHRVEDEIKNSRFITTANHASTVDEAREFVDAVREEFPDATHNCWAYLIGPPGSTRHNGSSDDGEPSGTAGRPMLTTLLNSGLGDVVVVVTRYFGGIKLGKGGLVRAYGGGVKRVLKNMRLAEHVEYVGVQIRVDYAAVETIRRMLPGYEAVVDEESYGVSAEFRLRIPEERLEDFERSVMDVTNGGADIEVINQT